MFSDRSTPDDWARKSASSLERIEKSLAEVTSALQALDARQREQDAKLESLVQGGGGAPQVHDGGAAGGVGEARESGTSGGVDKRLRQSASGRPAAGPAAASEEDDGRGSSASYRRPNCRVGSVDLTAMMEEVHMKNDAARKNSTEEHGGMKHVHNNRDSRRQELKNLSKVQSEEVFGMSSTIVDAFNTRKTEVEFKRRHEQALARRALLIEPHSKFRLYWDGVSCVLIAFIALALPYRSAFAVDWSLLWTLIDFFIDVFFIVDIFINLRTMYHGLDGQLVMNTRLIFLRYARSWLALDVVASIPFDWFRYGVSFQPPPVEESNAAASQLTQLLRIFRLIKLLRLLRVARLFRYLGKWEAIILAHFNSNWLRLMKLLGFLLLFSHWNGCVQFVVASLDTVEVLDPYTGEPTGELDIHPMTWVVRAHIMNEPESLRWSWCFYHAMTQLLAISVGVVPPRRPSELWGYLISILLGAALYAIFVASLTAVFTELGASGREYRSKLDMLHQYMRNLKMPADLRQKLTSYFELCFPDRQMFHENQILEQLSHPLQGQIALLKCKDVLMALRVLHDENLARTIALYLERVVFIEGDFVIRAGDFGRGMYFISTGTVEIFLRGQQTAMTTLGKHSFFGEMALLDRGGRATGDVRVKGFCEGYHLSRGHFDELLEQFPDFRQYIENVARLRLENLAKKDKRGDFEETNELLMEPACSVPVKRRLLMQHRPRRNSCTTSAAGAVAAMCKSVGGKIHGKGSSTKGGGSPGRNDQPSEFFRADHQVETEDEAQEPPARKQRNGKEAVKFEA